MRPIALKLTSFGLSVSIAVLILESGVRLAGLSSPSIGRVDPLLGWSLRPLVTVRKQTEGGAVVSTNSHGFRDDEHPTTKPPGTFRIAVLGDSFTLASHVDVEETYWSRLENHLTSCDVRARTRIETLNFGVTGYGTAQELLMLEHHTLAFDPDLFLLAVFPGNDIHNNLRSLAKDPMAPYFRIEGGALVLDDSFRTSRAYSRKKWTYEILYRFHIAQAVKQLFSARGHGPNLTTVEAFFRRSQDPNLYREPDDPTWTTAWDVTERLLDRIHSRAREHGIPLLATTLSTPIQVYPDPVERAALMTKLGIEDPWYPDRRISTIGDRSGFPVQRLGPPMYEVAKRTGRYFHGFPNTMLGVGHWNADGHAVAAELLAPFVCDAVRARSGQLVQAAPSERGAGAL